MIAGGGGIGQATGLILASSDALDCNLYIGDRSLAIAESAMDFVNNGSETSACHAFAFPESGSSPELEALLAKTDIILDCLPGSQAPRLAQFAKDNNCHYANLTEYVKETDQVNEIAKTANTGFVLQTGLAPGYINILGHHLFQKFTAEHNVDKVDSLDMKVGALSQNARSPYFYAYTWSPIGVATEYVKDAIVVEDYETKLIPSLSRTEKIILDGKLYEDDFTSGGAADLPSALAGKVKNLNYKTLRFPGHYDWAKGIISKTPTGQDKVEHLHNTMMANIPAVEDDVVIVFASVKGKDQHGTLRAMEQTLHIYPSMVGKEKLRAIQTTTAGPLCEAARMLLTGDHKGPIYQSQLNTAEFLNGPFVKSIYGPIN